MERGGVDVPHSVGSGQSDLKPEIPPHTKKDGPHGRTG